MISLVVPTAEMRERLEPAVGDVRVHVWQPDGTGALADRADILVLPYMVAPVVLGDLRGRPISIVQSQTLGYDGVEEHLPPGLLYCNAVDVHEGSTAELALALVLAAQRGIPDAVRDAQDARWNHRRQPGLAGKRVLLIGAGGVGAAIAARIAPFGVDLLTVARTTRAGVHAVTELPALLPTADVVILAVPLDGSTRGLVDARFLGAMRDGALLVNVSRGEIVDTDALIEHTGIGRLRAALDVVAPEPLPVGHPLWSQPGVLITPHVGGDTDAMDARVDRIVIEQVRRLREGEPPLNLVYDTRG